MVRHIVGGHPWRLEGLGRADLVPVSVSGTL